MRLTRLMLSLYGILSAQAQSKTCINELTVIPSVKAMVSCMAPGVYNASGDSLFLTALYKTDGTQVFNLLPQGYDGCLDGPGEYTLRNAACRTVAKSDCFQTIWLRTDAAGKLSEFSLLAPVSPKGTNLTACTDVGNTAVTAAMVDESSVNFFLNVTQ